MLNCIYNSIANVCPSEVCTAAMLYGKNNKRGCRKIFSCLKKMFILMQNIFIVPVMQLGHRAKLIFSDQKRESGEGGDLAMGNLESSHSTKTFGKVRLFIVSRFI